MIGLISRFDGLLIGKFFGASTLGLYRQAYQLLVVPVQQINVPISSVAQPALSRLQSDPERYRRYYQKMLFFISVMLIPIGIFIGIYAREIVLLLLGEKWIGAVPFIRIFSAVAAISPAIGTYTVVLVTCGKSAKFLLIALAHCVVLFLSMIVGIRYGAIGIAFAHLLTITVLAIPKLYYSFAGTPVTVGQFFKTTVSPLLASLCMLAAICVWLKFITITDIFLRLSTGGVVGAISYLAVLLLLPASRKDLIALYKDVTSSIQRKRLSEHKTKLSAA
jgi:O-antigen/teichoic acid export membrane protein